VGMAINWIGEFAPEITRVVRRHKKWKTVFHSMGKSGWRTCCCKA